MSNERPSSTVPAKPETNTEATHKPSRNIRRRSFLQGLGMAGAAVTTGALLKAEGLAQSSSTITQGDSALPGRGGNHRERLVAAVSGAPGGAG